MGKKQQNRLLWKRNRNNLSTFTFGTEASKMIAIITAVITWLGLRRIAFCFPGNMATWCLMAPKPIGTDLPTTASLQNTRRTKHLNTWRHAARNGPNRAPKPIGSTTPILLEADYASLTSTGIDTIAPGEFGKLNSQDCCQPLTWASLITDLWGAPTLWPFQSITLLPPHLCPCTGLQATTED